MGAKKKAPAKEKKGKGGPDEDDVSVDNFWKAYRKKCVEYGCDVSKQIKGAYENYQEEGETIKKFHFWEELGWVGTKAIVEALK